MIEKVLELKEKVENVLDEFFEFNEITIDEDDWIEISENEHILNLYNATIHIDINNPNDIGISFNVLCDLENVFHLTNSIRNMSEDVNLYLFESFIFDETGYFITGEDAYNLKEKYEINRIKNVLLEVEKSKHEISN